MDAYDFYITPEEYKKAAENGIGRRTLDCRIRDLGWDKETAINKPPKKFKKIDNHLVKLAEENGISYDTLRFRINVYGWDKERAVTEPVWDKEKYSCNLKKISDANRKYPKEILEMAEKNNISQQAFYNRVNDMGWDIEKAATEPIMTKEEVSRLGNEAYYKIYGHKFAAMCKRSKNA